MTKMLLLLLLSRTRTRKAGMNLKIRPLLRTPAQAGPTSRPN